MSSTSTSLISSNVVAGPLSSAMVDALARFLVLVYATCLSVATAGVSPGHRFEFLDDNNNNNTTTTLYY